MRAKAEMAKRQARFPGIALMMEKKQRTASHRPRRSTPLSAGERWHAA
jgi:hypothetical protein